VEVHRQRSLPNATCGICEKRADRSNLLGIALELYRVRRKFGVLFQDGALFGSMNIYDNVASRCASTPRSARVLALVGHDDTWKADGFELLGEL
jgi:ABC-type phosphate/phosphonate transport system ATPase subunit